MKTAREVFPHLASLPYKDKCLQTARAVVQQALHMRLKKERNTHRSSTYLDHSRKTIDASAEAEIDDMDQTFEFVGDNCQPASSNDDHLVSTKKNKSPVLTNDNIQQQFKSGLK